ncbi:MAG: septum formation initiator family protein [Acutalibacteraceae bacterium]
MFKLKDNIKKSTSTSTKALKRTLIVISAVVLILITVTISAFNFSKASAYKESADEASSACEEIKNDISKKEELIEGKGFDDYCEKIAREKYGYAKPGEYVIYDSSYGN